MKKFIPIVYMAFMLCGIISWYFFRDTKVISISDGTKKKEHRKGERPLEYWNNLYHGLDGHVNAAMLAAWRNRGAAFSTNSLNANATSAITRQLLENVEETGPYNIGGRTMALVIDKNNEDRVFAASASGGLWSSEDGGQQWAPKDEHASSLLINDMVQNPINPDILYYGTGHYLKSWPGDGIFKSINGGQTFSRTAGSSVLPPIAVSLACSKTDVNTLYVGTNAGFYFSTDGGSTFSRKNFVPSTWIEDVESFADGSVLLSVRNEGIYKMDPSGNVSRITNGLPDAASLTRIEMAQYVDQAAGVTKIYAVITNDKTNNYLGLYRSIDGGQSFEKINALKLPNTNDAPKQLWHYLNIEVDPKYGRIILAELNIFVSLDEGEHFTLIKPGHADNHAIAFPNTSLWNQRNDGYFLAGNDGGVYKFRWNEVEAYIKGQMKVPGYPNVGFQPISLNAGYRTTKFYAGDYFKVDSDYIAMGGTQDNGTIRLWKKEPYPGSRIVKDGDGGFVEIREPYAYAESQNGDFAYTNEVEDSGLGAGIDKYFEDWRERKPGLVDDSDKYHFISPFVMNPADYKEVYFASEQRIFRTTNEGENWRAITNALTMTSPTALAVDPRGFDGSGKTTVYFGMQNGTIGRIADARSAMPGNNLEIITPFSGAILTFSSIVPHPQNPGILYITLGSMGGGFKIFKGTHTGGTNYDWVELHGDLPSELPVNTIAIHPEDDQVLIAGTFRGLYISNNGGKNWYQDTRIPSVVVNQIRVREWGGNQKLFIFTFGRGIWTADLAKPISHLPYISSFENGHEEVWIASIIENSKMDRDDRFGGLHENTRWILNAKDYQQPSRSAMDLHINLGDHDPDKNLLLTFLYTSQNDNDPTRVLYSSDGGKSFSGYALHDLRPTTDTFPGSMETAVPATINLSKMAEKYNLTFTDHSVFRFYHESNGINQNQHISFDLVQVKDVAIPHMRLPYQTTFQSDTSWLMYDMPGLRPARIEGDNGGSNKVLVLDGAGYKDARLLLDLSGMEKDITLSFAYDIKNYTEDPGNHAGIYVRNPMIPTTETKVFTFPKGNIGWKEQTLNLRNVLSNQTKFRDDYVEIIFRGTNQSTASIKIDNLTIEENYEVAQLPYYTAFEAGSLNTALDPYWMARFSNVNSGRMEIMTANDAWGQKALALYGEGTVAKQQAHLHLNLQQASAIEVKFECNLFGYGNSLKKTRVLLYDATNPAAEPVEVKNLQNTTINNAFVQVNLKQEAAKHQLALSSDFVVVIETESGQPIPSSGILIDNVKVYPADKAVPAELPYITDFSEDISKHWKLTTNTGRSEVISWSDARFGSKALALHGNIYGCNYSAPESTNDADLHLNLAGMSGVKLQFHYRNYQNDGPLAGIQSGVWISDNGGYSLQKIYDFPSQNQLRDWERVEINLDSAVQARKLKYTENFVIVFRAFSRYKMQYHYSCRDGIAIDRVVVYESEEVQTEEKYIANEAHDGHEYDFKFRTIEDIRFSSNSASNSIGGASSMMKNYRTGLIWMPDIPKNAIILKANIQLTSSKTHTEHPSIYSLLEINAHQASNAPDFVAVPYIYSNRTMTKHNIPWLLHANWVKDQRGQKQRTPDLTVLTQRLVNLNLWAPGNKMCFFIKPQYPSQPAQFNAYAYRSYADNVIDMEDLPALHIEYITKDGKVGSTTARVSTEEDKFAAKNTPLQETFDFTEASDAVMIYPNPVTDQLTVQFPPLTAEDGLLVLDMQGSVVKQVAIQPGQTEWEIPMEDLPSGVYLLRFNSQEKVYRIIKK